MHNFLELNDKMEEIKALGWVKGIGSGSASVGTTFEQLLGMGNNKLEIPDFEGIEIKTKLLGSEPYITLFNANPDSYLFEIKRLQEKYGYPDRKNPEFKVLNISVYGDGSTNLNNKYLFKLVVDLKREHIFLNVYDNRDGTIDYNTGWSFDLLSEKLIRKLSYLVTITAQKKLINGELYFKYTKALFFKLKDFETFLALIERGIIRVTFKISVFKSGKRYGQIHDHGTSFDIKESDLLKLFSKENLIV